MESEIVRLFTANLRGYRVGVMVPRDEDEYDPKEWFPNSASDIRDLGLIEITGSREAVNLFFSAIELKVP